MPPTPFNGLDLHLGNLARLSPAQTRSISAENVDGAKGKGGMAIDGTAAHAARDLGQGWKVSPFVKIPPGHTQQLAAIDGPGAIQHFWIVPTGVWRTSILRIYWDGQEQPAVECPIGDFFASGWGPSAPLTSLAVCVNPNNAFNCYWQMPFQKHCRITLTNRADDEIVVYYQITYTLTEVPADSAYFHAQFRRVNPLPYGEVYTLLDGVRGSGHYVGTYMAWGAHNTGWWGEGEIKFYLDGDDAFPTICGTGTEDYFGGAWGFYNQQTQDYQAFSSPYSGMHQVIRPQSPNASQMRFGLYRWHLTDPIRFQQDLKVTMQALGWRSGGRYLPLQDDLASVAYWYQALPTAPFPPLPDRDYLEVI